MAQKEKNKVTKVRTNLVGRSALENAFLKQVLALSVRKLSP